MGMAFVEILKDGRVQEIILDRGGYLEYNEVTRGCSTYTLQHWSQDWTFWDSVIQKPDNSFRIRWGYGSSSEGIAWSHWKSVYCDRARLIYHLDGVDALIEGLDGGYVLNEEWKEKAYKDMTISEMVSEIAGRNDLSANVTTTDGKHTLYQGLLPSMQFILQECLPRAIDSSGRAEYKFYFQDGEKLVFSPPNLSGNVRNYRFATPGTDYSPQYLHVEYRRGLMSIAGAMKTRVRGFDPLKKECVEWTADDGTVSYPKLSSRAPKVPETPTRLCLTEDPGPPDYEEKEVETAAKIAWLENARSLYRLTLRVPFDPTVTVGGVVLCDIRDQRGSPHFTTGRYYLYEVRHRIHRKLETLLYLERRTSQAGG